jgi:predicted permease
MSPFSSIGRNLSYALRVLCKNPAHAVVIYLSLVLAIGANCAVFSVVNAALLRPLPLPNYDRLVRIFSANAGSGATETNASYLDFRDWQQQSHTFEHLAVYASGGAFLTGDGPSERVGATGVTADFFTVLGARPLMGRLLMQDDEKEGGAVISYRLWQQRYGGRADIVGHTLNFNGNTAPIVGVMPPDLVFPEGTDLWTVGVDTESPRASRGLSVIASRKVGTTVEESKAEMSSIAARLAEAYPETNRDWQARVLSLRELRTRNNKPAMALSFAGAVVLLLIACANIGTLQLVWVADRQQEFAVRYALGATRMQVIGLVLREAVLLCFAGAASGLLLMFWGLRGLLGSGIVRLGFVHQITVDFRVVAFTLLIVSTATLLSALAPVWHVLSVRPWPAVAEESRTSTSGAGVRRIHAWLVTSELSLVFVLLVTALLLRTSFDNVLHVNLGFDPQGVLTGRIAYFDDEKRIEFFRRVVERVRGLPGVADVATSYSLPLDAGGAYYRPAVITVPNGGAATQQVIASYHIVSPGYFRVLRMSLLGGREFAEMDDSQSLPVAIINESLAHRVFADRSQVGRPIACCEAGKSKTVVGVVRDLKSESPESISSPEIYVPFAQDSQVSMRILVRASEDPRRLLPDVRGAIASVDPAWPLYQIRTMEEIYDSAIAPRRSLLILIGSFASVALILSVAGIYGTFTYAAAKRSREFAIRMAVGANQARILQLILRDVGVLVVLGLGVGTVLALVMGHIIRSELFGVTVFDIRFYFEAIGLLAVTAFVCSLIPAIRASRTDPAPRLREL